jgi:tetratricopeptide (TPR) repeat protein
MDQLVDPEKGGVAHWAHVGGFAFGFVAAVAIRVSGLEKRFLQPALEAKVTYAENPEIDRALEHKANGELDQAYVLARRALQKDAGNPVAAMALWDIAKEFDKVAEAASLLVTPIRKDIQAGRSAAALKQLKELWDFVPNLDFDPLPLVRLGAQLAEGGRDADAVLVLERALPPGGTPLAAPVALRLARTAQGLDAGLAARAARSALGGSNIEPTQREQLETIVAAAPAPKPEGPAADSIDHSRVELSDEDDAETSDLDTSSAAAPDPFDHGVVELASDDGDSAASSESVDTDAFEFGELDLSTDDEGDLEKDDPS